MKIKCKHSWNYISKNSRQCKKCKLFQRQNWINLTGNKGVRSTCNICDKVFPTRIMMKEHKEEIHSL